MKRDYFLYEWQELTRARRLSAGLILQCIFLALAVGFGPDLVMYLTGYCSDIYPYKLYFMLLTVPLILILSIQSYRKKPESDITTSTLFIEDDVVAVTRHVIAETGRRFFVEWESIGQAVIKRDDERHILQINAKWKASAYKDVHGKAGRYIDSDCREHPQTFLLKPEKYAEALEYLTDNGYAVVMMTADELEKAQPFLHKHYEV